MSARGAQARERRARSAPVEEPRRRPRPKLRSVPAGAPSGGRRVPSRAGLLVVPLIAALLGGIVWINVAKLNVTAEAGRVLEQSRAIESENVRLQGQLEQRDSQVIDDAQDRLGLVPAANERIVRLRAPAAAAP